MSSAYMLRFIKPVGTREVLRVFWGDDCPNCLGQGTKGFHNGERLLRVLPEIPVWSVEAECFPLLVYDDTKATTGAFPEEAWPDACDHCPAQAPVEATRQFYRAFQYDSPEGTPQPNDCYYRVMGPGHYCAWDDCDGRHIIIVLPIPKTYFEWDPAKRASNCTKPTDRRHRCWVITGEPPVLSSVEAPHRCQAGKYSIEVPGVFHATLAGGEWTH